MAWRYGATPPVTLDSRGRLREWPGRVTLSLSVEPEERRPCTQPRSAGPTRPCFVFLLDQSASMQDPIGGGEGQRKCDVVADALNRLLSELTIKCAKEEGVRDYFSVSVIGYGGSTLAPRWRDRWQAESSFR